MAAAKPWLFRCRDCGFLASNLQPGPGTGLVGLEQLRRANAEMILDRIGQLAPLRGARILDVGCAKGWFLEAALRRGAAAHGIEPQEPHVRDARRAGLDVELGFFPQDLSDQGPYDVVAFNDVFEHLPSPERAIADVAARLKPGGLAVINLPSSDGVLYRIARLLDGLGASSTFERLWQKGLPSPHISYFSPATLRAMVERHTALREVAGFSLPSFQRTELRERIALTHRGPLAWGLFAGLWAASFVMPLLPSDIHVGVFRKPG